MICRAQTSNDLFSGALQRRNSQLQLSPGLSSIPESMFLTGDSMCIPLSSAAVRTILANGSPAPGQAIAYLQSTFLPVANAGEKRGKSLGVLSQQFLMLFLLHDVCNPRVLCTRIHGI
jgi:hypothetical protein